MKRTATLAAAALTLLFAGAALAKCTLTVKFKNNDSHTLVVLGSESQVRVNGGTWSKMNFNNVTVAPGATGTSSWTTNMSCGGTAKRDFRIKFEDKGNNVIYSNTNKNDIDIYDGQTLTWALKND
ncbi:MAG: hypothetical protein R3F60_10390 [bacterium]